MASGTINSPTIIKTFTIPSITIQGKDVYRYSEVTIPSGYIPIGSFLSTNGAENTISPLSPKIRSTDTTAIIELYNSYSGQITLSGATLYVVYARI